METITPQVTQPQTQPTAPTAEAPVQQQPQASPTVEQKPADLVTRASAVKLEQKKEIKEPEFDVKEIDKITDPTAKEYAEKAYKSFQRGFNQKFQELAEIRKKYEAEINQNSQWTPQRVQQMLQDKNFVEAAKQVIATQNPAGSGLTDEQYSALSESEKAEITQMREKLNALERQNHEAVKVQQDTELKSKYANYAPDIVDTTVDGLIKGQVRASREDIWKALDYDDAVKRAYELGKSDVLAEKKEKINSMSYEAGTITPNKEVPQKLANETDRAFLQRLYLNAVDKTKPK